MLFTAPTDNKYLVYAQPMNALSIQEQKFLIDGFEFFKKFELLTKKSILEPVTDYDY